MILTITLWLRQMKNQHLEVNFTFKVKINRLVTWWKLRQELFPVLQ